MTMRKIEINKPSWLPAFRSLVRCYQAHDRVAEEHFRQMGVTGAQFDILVTLGNTEGLTCRELGERTLITKGTLTGVVDRLIEKGWVSREACSTDRRVVYIRLTEAGVSVFERIFQPHLDYMSQVFEGVTPETWSQLKTSCDQLSHHITREAEPKNGASTHCGCDGEGI